MRPVVWMVLGAVVLWGAILGVLGWLYALSPVAALVGAAVGMVALVGGLLAAQPRDDNGDSTEG